jgi:FkbM family methyltransferase
MSLKHFVAKQWRKISPVVNYRLGKYTITLDTTEGIQLAMSFGRYEPVETEWVMNLIKPGMTVVDVGASFGYYSFIASSMVGDTGKVYSFEPSKPAFDSFIKNVAKNGITNIEAYQFGLGETESDLELFDSIGVSVNKWNIHAPTFVPQYIYAVNDRSMGFIHIERLDDFWEKNNLGVIDLIKIDVEGFERPVLQGMKRLFEKRLVKNIMIEYMQPQPLFTEGTESWFMHQSLTDSGFKITNKKQYTFELVEGSYIMGNFMYGLGESC